MKERMQKTLAEVKGCPQKDRTESEGYVGAQTFMWICEDNIVEVPFDKEHLLERILSPDNLNQAYKAVVRNKGCGGIDKMSCDFFQQKTAYEIVDCDWSSDVCSSDLI